MNIRHLLYDLFPKNSLILKIKCYYRIEVNNLSHVRVIILSENGNRQCFSWKGLSVSCSGCQMSVSSLRWPRTYTTCWSTTVTSWTVGVLSRWRGRGRWPLTSSPAVPRAVNTRPADRSVTPTARTQTAERLSGQLGHEHRGAMRNTRGTEDGQQRRGRPVCMLSRCTHVGRCSWLKDFSQAAREITKPSCLRTEVAMLVFMSNSTSISSGVIIYFRVDGFLWWPCTNKKINIYIYKCYLKRIYARRTWRMNMTKEQMFDMKPTLMILFKSKLK